jgi:hypothetical protein
MADDVSYSSLSVARKGLNQSEEWNIVGTDIYCGREYGSVCPPSSDRLGFIHDLPYGFTTLSSAVYRRGYCEQYLRWVTYHHSWRYYIFTRVDRASVGFRLMVISRGISWGTEWNLAQIGQGRVRRSGLHEPTNRPRVPLSCSFYGYEQSSRDDPPWVWCVSEVEMIVLVAPGESCGKQRNYSLQMCQFEWHVRRLSELKKI